MTDWHPDIPEEYRNQIVTGDALRLTAGLPDESIGVIVTSPPYNVGLKYDGFDDNMPEDKFILWNRDWLREAFRVCKDGGRLYAVTDDRMLWWFRNIAEQVGWTYGQLLTWCKPNFVGQAGKVTGDWNYMTEQIILLRKGKRSSMLRGETTTHNWFVEVTPQSNHKGGRIHPAQWPVNLPLRILSRTPGEPVLDFFAGSASGLVAAKILGRKYIGFELVESVAERARRRVRETNPPLFVPEPVQLAMSGVGE